MADTNLTIFNNGIAYYLTTYIYPPIVRGLAAKGVTVSVEELSYFTNTPVVHPPSFMSPQGGIPTGFGTVPNMVNSVQPTKKTSSANSSAVPEAIPGRTCLYRYRRGIKQGLCCGKATVSGNDYCNACIKTHKIATDKGATNFVPGVNNIPGASGFPTAYNNPTYAVPEPTPGKIDVEVFDAARSLYIEPNHKFIVCQKNQQTFAVGRFDKESNKVVTLTQEEGNIAKNLGFQLGSQGDLPIDQFQQSQTMTQQLPQVATQQSMQNFQQPQQQAFVPQQSMQNFQQPQQQAFVPPQQQIMQNFQQPQQQTMQTFTPPPQQQTFVPPQQQIMQTFTPPPQQTFTLPQEMVQVPQILSQLQAVSMTNPNLQQSPVNTVQQIEDPNSFSIPLIPQLDDGSTIPTFE